MAHPAISQSPARCSRGWGARCPASHGSKCRCACGGANHGVAGVRVQNRVPGDRHACWDIVKSDAESVTIRDVGPWDQRLTITNDAEFVVAKMKSLGLGSRRLFYYDSDGQLDELVHDNGRFVRFAPGPHEVSYAQAYDSLSHGDGSLFRDYKAEHPDEFLADDDATGAF